MSNITISTLNCGFEILLISNEAITQHKVCLGDISLLCHIFMVEICCKQIYTAQYCIIIFIYTTVTCQFHILRPNHLQKCQILNAILHSQPHAQCIHKVHSHNWVIKTRVEKMKMKTLFKFVSLHSNLRFRQQFQATFCWRDRVLSVHVHNHRLLAT